VIAALLPILGSIGSRVAASLFPDPADKLKAQELENKLTSEILASSAAIEQAAADIVRTEAASSHWLAANWRPLTMLIFVGLIVSRWLGYTAESMTEAEYLSVYDLVKIGLGGYVVGRSVEKVAPAVLSAMKKG
jgi:hypothetical protein